MCQALMIKSFNSHHSPECLTTCPDPSKATLGHLGKEICANRKWRKRKVIYDLYFSEGKM